MKKFLLFIILLAGGATIWWGVTDRGASRQKNGMPYEEASLVYTTLVVSIESTGVVEPRNRLQIKPPIAGRIEDVLVEEGQTVERGEIMAWLSSTERATLLDAARTKDEATARKWEEIYRATPLMAPLDGTVIARNTEPGQTVTASDTVLVLSDRLIVRAQVDETDIGRVRTNMPARITLDAYADVELKAVVNRIAYEAITINNVTIYEVEVEPEETPLFMKSGMTATVSFQLKASPETWALPVDAVETMNGEARVLIASDQPDKPPVSRKVTTGLSVRGWVAITSGLEGDERVVKPIFRLPDEKEMAGSPFLPSRMGRGRSR